MKLLSGRYGLSTLLCSCVAGVALMAAALAQPPVPGGKGAPSAPGGAPGPGGGAGPGGGPGPGSGPGGAPGPGGPSPTFTLRFCNKTNDIQSIFVSVASIAGQQFRAQGWSQVPLGQCIAVGNFQRPAVWFHARDPGGVSWTQKPDADLCVNLNGGFDYTWGGSGRQCGQGETAVPFVKIDIAPNANTFTMTLN